MTHQAPRPAKMPATVPPAPQDDVRGHQSAPGQAEASNPASSLHLQPGMTALTVTAYLAGGIAHTGPWGIALDGIIAAELWADTKHQLIADGTIPSALHDTDDPLDLDLPLARCVSPDDRWHWAATCASPTLPSSGPHNPHDADPPDVHYIHARPDHTALEQIAERFPATLPEHKGRYRARRLPLLVTATPSVTWHAIGHADPLEQLLSTIRAIGKKRSHGEGHVLSWHITPHPFQHPWPDHAAHHHPSHPPTSAALWAAAHLDPHGTLGRPSLPACLHDHPHVRTGGTGTAGLRPPYMHRSRQHQLLLPATPESHQGHDISTRA